MLLRQSQEECRYQWFLSMCKHIAGFYRKSVVWWCESRGFGDVLLLLRYRLALGASEGHLWGG